MKYFFTIFLILFIFVGMSAPKPRTQKEDLPNFHKVNEKLYRGGQPSEEGIHQLAKLGIKTIINFRDTDGKVRREQQLAEENGMKFYNPHLSNWFASKDDEINKILEIILNPKNQPVFIHCKRGADRTGTVVAAYRMKFENWTDKDANQEAKAIGLGWWQVWMRRHIHEYYKKLEK